MKNLLRHLFSYDPSFLELSVTLTEDNYEVNEDEGTVEICVERIGESAEDITVTISAGESTPASAEGKKLKHFFVYFATNFNRIFFTHSWRGFHSNDCTSHYSSVRV